MTAKKLTIMAVIFLALAIIAVVQKHHNIPQHKTITTTLFDGIDLNTVTGIEISQGTNSVTLTKKDGKWEVASLYNYPTDFKRLANAIRTTADLKTDTPVPSGNIKMSEFGLGKSAKHITLKKGNENILTIDVGDARDASKTTGWANQHFIKKSGDDTVYLVNSDFRIFDANANRWIETKLLDINSGDITEIKTDNVTLKLEGTDWKLPDLKEQEELKSTEANSMRGALQYLTCTTIANPAKTDKELGFDKPITFTATTKDGITYKILLGNEAGNNGRYVRISASYIKPATPEAPAKDAKDDVVKEYKAKLDKYNTTVAANEDKVKKINEKLSKWTYIIPNYKAETMLKKREDIVKAKEQKKEETNEKKGTKTDLPKK